MRFVDASKTWTRRGILSNSCIFGFAQSPRPTDPQERLVHPNGFQMTSSSAAALPRGAGNLAFGDARAGNSRVLCTPALDIAAFWRHNVGNAPPLGTQKLDTPAFGHTKAGNTSVWAHHRHRRTQRHRHRRAQHHTRRHRRTQRRRRTATAPRYKYLYINVFPASPALSLRHNPYIPMHCLRWPVSLGSGERLGDGRGRVSLGD